MVTFCKMEDRHARGRWLGPVRPLAFQSQWSKLGADQIRGNQSHWFPSSKWRWLEKLGIPNLGHAHTYLSDTQKLVSPSCAISICCLSPEGIACSTLRLKDQPTKNHMATVVMDAGGRCCCLWGADNVKARMRIKMHQRNLSRLCQYFWIPIQVIIEKYEQTFLPTGRDVGSMMQAA